MSIPSITKEEILQAIRNAQVAQEQRPPNTYTAKELGKILEMSPDSARRRADEMIALGIARKTEIIAVNGKGARVPTVAFTLLFPPKSPA